MFHSMDLSHTIQGAGDSGKSTFLKQMLLYHKDGFSDVELNNARNAIQGSVFRSAQILASKIRRDDLTDPGRKSWDYITDETIVPNPDCGKVIADFWAQPKVQEIFVQRIDLKLNLDSNIATFMDDSVRVFASDFKPTNADVLASRTITTGIVEQEFPIPKESLTIKIVDVGGQRSERRKWMSQFDNVDLVMYFSALDGYALQMHESESNRLADDLRLFASLMLLVPQKKAWVFLQNKVDIFKTTLQKYPITEQYPDLPKDKSKDPDYCMKFLEDEFRKKWVGQKTAIKFYQTCALDTDQIKMIWGSIKKSLTAETINEYIA